MTNRSEYAANNALREPASMPRVSRKTRATDARSNKVRAAFRVLVLAVVASGVIAYASDAADFAMMVLAGGL